MVLNSLSLLHFKNFDARFFEFEPKINCFVGQNGIGKTNVLDAIYHLSYTKGYFNSVGTQCIQHDNDYFLIEGNYEREEKSVVVSVGLKKGHKKVVKKNGKEYEKLSDHFGFLPAVIISPSDTDLIKEGSDLRRKFIDGIIAMNDNDFLNDLLSYNQTLAQRNALLKFFAANRTFDKTNLDIYNQQLADFGTKIYAKRKAFVDQFIEVFQKRYKQILGISSEKNSEEINLKYDSQLHEQDLSSILIQNESKDKLLQYTSSGIHRDDIVFLLAGFPIKKFGSQGQQKSLLIALKLAQFDFLKEKTKITPIMLLDDIFDKLDDNRVSQLIELVNDHNFGQIFITDTHASRTEEIVKKVNQQYKMFELG
ncbi:DNA replication/repair protein RecF [Namhaeicola litoreus]|uniref:DNA replication and repair protein RecF n=1 Tax=Namhaeicola litoreus TaxID=1052145 RepID=A0ABW3Y574_9FLAO